MPNEHGRNNNNTNTYSISLPSIEHLKGFLSQVHHAQEWSDAHPNQLVLLGE